MEVPYSHCLFKVCTSFKVLIVILFKLNLGGKYTLIFRNSLPKLSETAVICATSARSGKNECPVNYSKYRCT